MSSIAAFFKGSVTQLFPGKPGFTEADVPDQSEKVFMVTGGNAGMGYELVKILYHKGAKVYMASRSKTKAEIALKQITSTPPTNRSGQVKILIVDLADLRTIKPAIEAFAAQESKLDILWNNAGIGSAPAGERTKQGYEVLVGTNALGPYLLTKLLLPYLKAAASTAPKNSVRVAWYGSPIIEGGSVPPGGIAFPDLSKVGSNFNDQTKYYAMSKVGNWFLASELDNRIRGHGIISLCLNPGNLRTAIWDTVPWYIQKLMSVTMHPPVYGAYTALWTGLYDGLTVEDGGKYVVPWGKMHAYPRADLSSAMKSEQNGGTGEAGRFWDWCEEETKRYG